ncbi:MAG TPA: hypothetical protein ENN63_08485 [Bacteroidetes bacterium]|nr:hypothetical protein [Bacteroidota bacterium]
MRPALMFISFLLLPMTVIGQTDQNDLFQSCRQQAGEDAVYLKDFVVKFPAARDGQDIPVSKNSVILSKNIVYRFTICSSDQLEGEAILQLWDDRRMLVTNHVSGKVYSSIEFHCQKTGRYHVLISFKEGKAGEAVSIMSYIRD